MKYIQMIEIVVTILNFGKYLLYPTMFNVYFKYMCPRKYKKYCIIIKLSFCVYFFLFFSFF